jgi:hypothetical protein
VLRAHADCLANEQILWIGGQDENLALSLLEHAARNGTLSILVKRAVWNDIRVKIGEGLESATTK